MPLIDDILLDQASTDPRVKTLFAQIIDILNNGGYQQPTYAQAPLVDDAGFEGEVRNVQSGNTLQEYKYVNGKWWKSDATQTSGWSLVN